MPDHSRLWRLPGRELILGGRTLIMAVINVTPDSFSDGGAFSEPQRAVEHGLRLASEGADLLDVGGESARPGSEPVSAALELRRVLPVIEGLAAETSLPISIDTTKAEVAEAALAAGASVINDISALRQDPQMPALAASSGAGLVLMHMQGLPKTMQDNPYYDDVVSEVALFLARQVNSAVASGVERERIVVDPGIGFGKTFEHNLALIANLAAITRATGRPVLLGASRKAFIGHLTGRQKAAERVLGSVGAHVIGAAYGARLVRVHDVAPLREALAVADAVREARG